MLFLVHECSFRFRLLAFLVLLVGLAAIWIRAFVSVSPKSHVSKPLVRLPLLKYARELSAELASICRLYWRLQLLKIRYALLEHRVARLEVRQLQLYRA